MNTADHSEDSSTAGDVSGTGATRSKSETKLFGNGHPLISRHSKHELYKEQRRHYRHEKKRAAKQFVQTVSDPTLIIIADWLKVRSILKNWSLLYCVVKPGLMLLYKSEKQRSRHWVGTVLLNVCEVIERPSKKDGFCFKVFHPLEQSIWAPRGPTGEAMGALTKPLPWGYAIFRSPSEAIGRLWMEALEIGLSDRVNRSLMGGSSQPTATQNETPEPRQGSTNEPSEHTHIEQGSDEEAIRERHFDCEELDIDNSSGSGEMEKDDQVLSDDETHSESDPEPLPSPPHVESSPYQRDPEEDFSGIGEESQTEEVNDEGKSIIWTLVKQVRPGMDLSKVVLPTFILEPRSFLEKLADYYFHCDILTDVASKLDPYVRMKDVVKFYLSGFYKKPKGLKKPYNPILGEVFRCYWKKGDSTTFYIAEQISHHPPVTAFYVSNRRDGFTITGELQAKSKFYGNSLSAIMNGEALLNLLPLGETYSMTLPYAHCKGILVGTLSMELGGKVVINCEKTGYTADLDFRLKPLLSAEDCINRVIGRIRLGSNTISEIKGRWDGEIWLQERNSETSELLWKGDSLETRQQRLPRYTIPNEKCEPYESRRLWQQVSVALNSADQTAATAEKFKLEECQRQETKQRKLRNEVWQPRLFEYDNVVEKWLYKYSDERPWDERNDMEQIESCFQIHSVQRHPTPIVRSHSILSIPVAKRKISTPRQLQLSGNGGIGVRSRIEALHEQAAESDDSQTRIEEFNDGRKCPNEQMSAASKDHVASSKRRPGSAARRFTELEVIINGQAEINQQLRGVAQQLKCCAQRLNTIGESPTSWAGITSRDIVLLFIVIFSQLVFLVIEKSRSNKLPGL